MKKKQQYSKLVIAAMLVLWFAAAIFGGIMVCFDSYHLDSLLSYIGMPVGGAVVGYLCKSAFENHEKIKQNYRYDYDLNINFDWEGEGR